MKIAIDAGHGLHTAGKRIPDGSMREWEFNSSVASKVVAKLKNYKGVETLRLDDISGATDVPLNDRTAKARNWGAKACVSIHANAFGSGGFNSANGIETFISPDGLPASEKGFADAVQAKLIAYTGLSNRGVKTANFAMVKVSGTIPSILVECGFMTNKVEAEKLKQDGYRETCASAIVAGIVAYFGLVKEVTTVESVQILTGGLGAAGCAEVTAYFMEKDWWGQLQFTTDGKNPRMLSGGLSGTMLTEYKAWLDAKGWFYEVV